MNKYRVDYSFERPDSTTGFRSNVIEADDIPTLIYKLYSEFAPSQIKIKIYRILIKA